MRSPFGFVIIDKPQGLTSHDCVQRLRRLFGIRRIGHGGTLDPGVTGVLPIAIGNATRLLPYLPGDKTYTGTILLGKKTNTDDIYGETIVSKNWPKLETHVLEEYLDHFRGCIQQEPPQISSVHFLGERAYKRARKGETMHLAARTINIHDFSLLSWKKETGQLDFIVHCSAGTYIRSIARDLGDLLGCGGCLEKLKRTQAMGFTDTQTISLPEIQKDEKVNPPRILGPLEALGHLGRVQLLTEKEVSYWRTGRQIIVAKERYQGAPKPQVLSKSLISFVAILDCEGEVAGIANWVEDSILQPKVVFQAYG